MGFQWRKRTKGKTSWFNFSASKSRGFGSSMSVKFGQMTANFGSGGRRRVTLNLGNGLRYVKTRTVKPKEKKPFDSAAFASNLESVADRFEKSKANAENWTKGEWWAFIVVVTIICVIIQLTMRAFA